MADSNITITNLVATPGVGQNLIAVTTAGGGLSDCLSYLTLQKVEIWASATNNRGAAALIGTTSTSTLPHGGLAASTTRYYWARAVDQSNLLGEWYPLSATAGVMATTSNQVPPDNSVGTPQLQDGAATATKIANAAIGTAHIQNAAINDAQINNLSAAKLTAGTITATISIVGPTITGGTIRTAATGARMEMTLTANNLSVYNASNVQVAYYGYPFSLQPVLLINNTAGPAANFNGGAYSASTVFPTVSIKAVSGQQVLGLDVVGGGAGVGHGARVTNSATGTKASVILATTFANGNWSAYAETGNGYGPFTGAHDGFLAKHAASAIGDLVCDVRVLARKGISNTVTEVKVCDAVAMNSVVGVIAQRSAFDPNSLIASFIETANTSCNFLRRYCTEHFDRLILNAVGDGQLNVCGRGGNLLPGDLICTSDLQGKGQRQADHIVRASTAAKVREAVTFSHPDEVKLVSCIYHCG